MRQAWSHTQFNSLRDHMILTRTAPIPDFTNTFKYQALQFNMFSSTCIDIGTLKYHKTYKILSLLHILV